MVTLVKATGNVNICMYIGLHEFLLIIMVVLKDYPTINHSDSDILPHFGTALFIVVGKYCVSLHDRPLQHNNNTSD